MAEFSTEKAALEAILDQDDAIRQILDRLSTRDLQRLAEAAQDLVTRCHDAWLRRLAAEIGPNHPRLKPPTRGDAHG